MLQALQVSCVVYEAMFPSVHVKPQGTLNLRRLLPSPAGYLGPCIILVSLAEQRKWPDQVDLLEQLWTQHEADRQEGRTKEVSFLKRHTESGVQKCLGAPSRQASPWLVTVDQEPIGHFGAWTLVLFVCGDVAASVWGPWKHTCSRA